jgi:hypothetical protein
MKLTRAAISPNKGNKVKIRPIMTMSGFPGGCGIPKMRQTATYSPASQKEAVGAMVLKYAIRLTRKTKIDKNTEILSCLSYHPFIRSFTYCLLIDFSYPAK